MGELSGAIIEIKGIVQGVGFRPFVYSLASQLMLKGWVRNTSAGVDIQVDGSPEMITSFLESLRYNAPPLARIDALQVENCAPQGFSIFEIIHSKPTPGAFQPISPDVCICPDCLSELLNPSDRRYLYPFINCTNCGPRFTIIQDIPYDRPNTTMSGFPMCLECAVEYADPTDRRFHAQPVACHVCGPHIWLEFRGEKPVSEKGLDRERSRSDLVSSQRLLLEGKILAIKGLGGFHLACDAQNAEAVAELRRRKLRVDKPFAVMMPDIETIEQHCQVSESERTLLESRQRPIVILNRLRSSTVAEMVAPGQTTIGVMLPYTPLHYLLVSDLQEEYAINPAQVLVMTSGNLSEEPIATDNDVARKRLASLADAFLMHNRPIHTRCDDSVARIIDLKLPAENQNGGNAKQYSYYPIRRSRGYAPDAIKLPWEMTEILAAGAELKNTFCLTKQDYAFISHHIGDLENYETLCAFEDGVAHYERLFRIKPSVIAYDLHPDYLASRYALQRAERDSLPACGVQHHHAHIASCMAEHHLPADQRVIGVSFDGTGFGEDGCIWGGEFLVCGYDSYTRPYHLRYTPLPGGDKAIREPWRMALSWMSTAGIPWDESLPPLRYQVQKEANYMQRLDVLQRQIQSGLNAPPTSSIGRLFDAVAAIIGIKQVVNYEAQAAIELEALATEDESGAYSFTIESGRARLEGTGRSAGVFDPEPVFSAILEDMEKGVSQALISARFHNGLAQVVREICNELREETGFDVVALSGGVWQNVKLLRITKKLLNNAGFNVLIHRQVPANDGGIALGQAVVAANRLV
ncbi:MAG: carbamoyltransferase HypF [Chloroflexi bacterium RBG_16_54_18]|nr:MAG: carbamoyltransferase HypF [Chloroflexi bacterium RBG_16_54_18]